MTDEKDRKSQNQLKKRKKKLQEKKEFVFVTCRISLYLCLVCANIGESETHKNQIPQCSATFF